jgi:hypothetical protein
MTVAIALFVDVAFGEAVILLVLLVSPLSGIDPLGTARKLPVRKKKSDSY